MSFAPKTLKKVARDNRWLSPDEDFDFAKAYTKPAIRQPLAVPRMRRLNKLLAEKEFHNIESIKNILRDHYDGEIISERFGVGNGTFLSICMHMREWGDSETTASIISTSDDILGIISRFALAQPCCSLYLPIYFTGYIPKKVSEGGRYFSEDSLWWKFKRLALIASIDGNLCEEMRERLDAIEALIEKKAHKAENEARELWASSNTEEAKNLLNYTMDEAAALAEKFCDEEFSCASGLLREKGGLYGPQKENVQTYCDYARMSIC